MCMRAGQPGDIRYSLLYCYGTYVCVFYRFLQPNSKIFSRSHAAKVIGLFAKCRTLEIIPESCALPVFSLPPHGQAPSRSLTLMQLPSLSRAFYTYLTSSLCSNGEPHRLVTISCTTVRY